MQGRLDSMVMEAFTVEQYGLGDAAVVAVR